MFDGMKNGDLDVKFFPRNSKEAQIVIKNTTDKPLNVHLPDAFAGVPVLGQALGAGQGNNRTTKQRHSRRQSKPGRGRRRSWKWWRSSARWQQRRRWWRGVQCSAGKDHQDQGRGRLPRSWQRRTERPHSLRDSADRIVQQRSGGCRALQIARQRQGRSTLSASSRLAFGQSHELG